MSNLDNTTDLKENNIFLNQLCAKTADIINELLIVADAESKPNNKFINMSDVVEKLIGDMPASKAEATVAIKSYLEGRKDLTVHDDKFIYRPDTKIKILMTVSECASRHYDLVKSKIPDILDQALLSAEKAYASKEIRYPRAKIKDITKELSEALSIKEYDCYHNLKRYIKNERTDLEIYAGRGGGVGRKNL